MNNRKSTAYSMAVAAMIAAAYTAVSLMLLPFIFGPVQVRVSEALTLLAVFSPAAIWGVTLGCALTNAIGVATGAVLLPDVFVGTAATLIAALLTWRLRNIRLHGLPVLASIPPVLVNAVLVGAELTWMFFPMELKFFLFNALAVGIGEVIACCGAGLLLVWALEKKGLDQKLFRNG